MIKVFNISYINQIYLLVFITNICNCNCVYCYNKKEKKSYIDGKKLVSFLKNIRQQTDKILNINLIGGEPSTYPELQQLIDSLNKIYGIKINIFTNLSYGIDFYLSLGQKNCMLTATYHPNYYDPLIFSEKINQLSKMQIISDMVIMYDSNIENINACLAALTNITFNIEINKAIGMNYTKRQLDEFDKLNNNLQKKHNLYKLETCGKNDNKQSVDISFNELTKIKTFKRWYCEAGMSCLYIHSDGKIYNCESYYSESKKPIGSIYKAFELPTHGIICDCSRCSGDYGIKKVDIFNK